MYVGPWARHDMLSVFSIFCSVAFSFTEMVILPGMVILQRYICTPSRYDANAFGHFCMLGLVQNSEKAQAVEWGKRRSFNGQTHFNPCSAVYLERRVARDAAKDMRPLGYIKNKAAMEWKKRIFRYRKRAKTINCEKDYLFLLIIILFRLIFH